ncbi:MULTISPECIES: group II intron reverse transcriptase/maturase [Pseudomonadota]|jgi:RNA-directed DNA polymerase|uniref:group II intron reverse transcriptase/maturase n=1 Tax=Pseudomonadota TaxID=1224 RepID=UPI000CDB20D9|nr:MULTISPECIES: group II intron reverse transcriptase/maturase [Pseudomonadota]KAB0753329.1 group II intron reverse transcriptase/maturase [Pseudomonas aeruginosa]MCW5409143.1 group II intron reverse transcriptase/maturase [Pseudomonas aeruginosa]MCW5414236.1 group II intron reverse transcriptase/maturase [Pseudomonas aeruginosa]MDH4695444.1 group II intron reverse transcriptase/maturase [Pseudomonas aeruginosa]POR10361.1 group II intron reverse transcriptase/maturase [Diaphorobacter sp. LR20
MPMLDAMRQKPAQAGRDATTRGEASDGACRGEADGPRHDKSGTGSTLLEAALTRENLQQAFKRVRANKGSAGVDGLDIDQTARMLVTEWPRIRRELLRGTYRPSPVRRVTIPKPDGGKRELGIPTVTDRLIQQALLQVLQPLLDPTFSEHSYGFRPGRRAHDAVLAAQSFVQSGRHVVVDVDLEKFFDRVNHDILIDRLNKRINDAGVIRLVRAYLNAGIMDGGVVMQRHEGAPQGGPLSPLLANVLLDEVDRELERRGHCFVRYADDCNVYVRSAKAGERVMALLRRLYGRLKLKVNEAKSAVAPAFGRKFLGYALWRRRDGAIRRTVAAKPLAAFKQRIREATRRKSGRSMQAVVNGLRPYLLGWKAYFSLSQTPILWRELGAWLRHRLRALQLKHWRSGRTMYRELRALGASHKTAILIAANSRRWWHNSGALLNYVLTLNWFDRLGLPRLA